MKNDSDISLLSSELLEFFENGCSLCDVNQDEITHKKQKIVTRVTDFVTRVTIFSLQCYYLQFLKIFERIHENISKLL